MRPIDWITFPLVCVACMMLSAIWFAALAYDLFFSRSRICPLCGSSVGAKGRYRIYRITPSRN